MNRSRKTAERGRSRSKSRERSRSRSRSTSVRTLGRAKQDARERFKYLVQRADEGEVFDPWSELVVAKSLGRDPVNIGRASSERLRDLLDQTMYEEELMYLTARDQWKATMPRGTRFDINDPANELVLDLRRYASRVRDELRRRREGW